MAWIESHQALERHPKVLHLSRLMAWDLDGTIGKLHRFWWWCLDYAPTGDLRTVDPLSIPQGLGLEGLDAEKFLPAMMQSHWICPMKGGKTPFRVHDWVNYSGGYLRDSKFRRHPDKWAQVVDLYKLPCQPTVHRRSVNQTPTVGGLSAVPNLTNLPDLTLPNLTAAHATHAPTVRDECGEFIAAYPPEKRNGGKAIRKAWEKAKDRPSIDVILAVLESHKRSAQWKKDNGQFIPNATTWINQGRWDTVLPPSPTTTMDAFLERGNSHAGSTDVFNTTGVLEGVALADGAAVGQDLPNDTGEDR